MKLITWNIQWGRGIDKRVDLERIIQTARSLADFDVLCVQEVADNIPYLDERDQFALVAQLLPGFHAVPGISTDAPDGTGRRQRFGNALFSRLPVLSIRTHQLPWPIDSEKAMPRVAIEVHVATPIGPVRVTTTHLEYYSAAQRRAQVRRLWELHGEASRNAAAAAAMAAKAPYGVTPQTTSAILTADFNFPPGDPAYDDIQRALPDGGFAYTDAWRAAEGRRAHPPTFCVHERKYGDAPFCCDFIFVSENLAPRVRRVVVDVETRASDHQPVLLELDDR